MRRYRVHLDFTIDAEDWVKAYGWAHDALWRNDEHEYAFLENIEFDAEEMERDEEEGDDHEWFVDLGIPTEDFNI